MKNPMTVQGAHICIDVECPECGHTEQIEDYDALSIEDVYHKEYLCPQCETNES